MSTNQASGATLGKQVRVKVGTFKDLAGLRKAMDKARIDYEGYADRLLDKVPVSQSELTLDVAIVSLKDLGFPSHATYQELIDAATRHGLELCPAEVGPYLRMVTRDDKEGYGDVHHEARVFAPFQLLIAMEPIADSQGVPRVFMLDRDKYGVKLQATDLHRTNTLDYSYVLAFMRTSGHE